jgi:hypothetical protein
MKGMIFTLVLLASVTGFAEKDKSGGDGVLTAKGLALLDLAEKEPFEIKTSSATAKIYADKILPIFKKLESSYFDFHIQYEKGGGNEILGADKKLYIPYFFKKIEDRLAWYFTDQELPEVDDEGACYFEQKIDGIKKQVAVQFPSLNIVVIHRPSFNQFIDDDHRAGLIVHEVTENYVYEMSPELLSAEGVNGKKCGTTSVRTYTTTLLGKDFLTLDSRKVLGAAVRIGLRSGVTSKDYYGSGHGTGFVSTDMNIESYVGFSAPARAQKEAPGLRLGRSNLSVALSESLRGLLSLNIAPILDNCELTEKDADVLMGELTKSLLEMPNSESARSTVNKWLSALASNEKLKKRYRKPLICRYEFEKAKTSVRASTRGDIMYKASKSKISAEAASTAFALTVGEIVKAIEANKANNYEPSYLDLDSLAVFAFMAEL